MRACHIVKLAGALQNNLNAQLFPGQFFRVAFARNFNLLLAASSINQNRIFFGLDLAVKTAINRVVLKQMRQCFDIAQIINRRHFKVGVISKNVAQNQPANTAETVYRNFCHIKF